ncbi:MAG: hypothetical protein OEV40_12780 [Acidimicrobiia bacterium]|nr:hypothetical protein [Acidimicrobiia bacterium]
MAADPRERADGPRRLSPAEWLDRFTDFGKIHVHPDPPFLRREPVPFDPPTLRLKRISVD